MKGYVSLQRVKYFFSNAISYIHQRRCLNIDSIPEVQQRENPAVLKELTWLSEHLLYP